MSSWLCAELHFASLYSYRMPNLSPSFALASPLPSPVAIRLALVDAAIQHTGNVGYGEEIFEIVKAAPLEVEPPDRVCLLKFFIRRMKPGKKRKGEELANLVESTGVREYCHFEGPMKIYLQVAKRADEIIRSLLWLRRLGTTDSLLRCDSVIVVETEPPFCRTWKQLSQLPLTEANFAHRLVVTLNEFDPAITFEQVSPYARGSPEFKQKVYALPLIQDRRGENWALFRKKPFEVGEFSLLDGM